MLIKFSQNPEVFFCPTNSLKPKDIYEAGTRQCLIFSLEKWKTIQLIILIFLWSTNQLIDWRTQSVAEELRSLLCLFPLLSGNNNQKLFF